MKCKLLSGCKNDIFKELDYCSLHCSDEEIKDNDIDSYLEDFSNLFMENLFESIISNKFYKVGKDGNDIPDYEIKDFKYSRLMENDSLIEKLGSMDIVIKNIRFPKIYNKGNLNLSCTNLVKKIGRINFKYCYFYDFYFIGAYNSYYEYCFFNENVNIYPFPHVVDKEGKDSLGYRYSKCIFFENVNVLAFHTDEMHCNVFEICDFKKDILVSNLKFKKSLFRFSDSLMLLDSYSAINTTSRPNNEFDTIKNCYKIEKLTIKNCVFKEDFKINGFDIDDLAKIKLHGVVFGTDNLVFESLKILDTKFESKLEIKNRVVKDFEFKNSNVEKVFDSFESRFEKSYFYKSIFTDFAGFEKVEFGLEGQDIEAYQAKFIYTTFMSFSNFRQTNFHSGLDFENSNLKEQPNFLKTNISSKNANRETFRIVKHSFDSVGNKIEANKFYSKEMDAYRREMKGKFKPSERFVFCMNSFISEFGTSYLKPILLLIILFEVYIILLSYYGGAYSLYGTIVQLDILNSLAKDFLLFSRFLKSGFEFASLIFYILSGILIWQIAVAIKRHTQR